MIELVANMIAFGFAAFIMIQIVRAIVLVLTELFQVFVKVSGTFVTVSLMIWLVLNLVG